MMGELILILYITLLIRAGCSIALLVNFERDYKTLHSKTILSKV